MKIFLSETQTDQITELRESLAKCRHQIVSGNSEYTRLEERAEQRRDEIKKLQDGDPLDKKISAALREANDELELIESRLGKLDHAASSTHSPATARASELMREISHVIGKALQPVVDARLDETIKVVRPLFVDDAMARGAAWMAPFYFQFGGYCTRPYGRAIGAPLPEIKACLDFCDEVLSGELKFSFDPKTK